MSNWYAIRTATRQEQKVVDGLHDLRHDRGIAIDVYLPQETRWNRLTRIRTIKQVPMLPGYLFVNVEPEHLWRVDQVEGVYQILGWAQHQTMREATKFAGFVGALREGEAAGLFDKTNRPKPGRKAQHRYEKGQEVQILAGPFGGFIGQIADLNGADRLRVMLSIFGRVTPVEVDARDVEAQHTAPKVAA